MRTLTRHLTAFALTAASLVAVVHCGGAVSEAPACPAQLTGTCASGDLCAETTTNSCGVTVSVDCRCDSTSHWACDAPAACKPPVDVCPPQGVDQGQSCSVKGAQCETLVACAGGGFGPGKGPPPGGQTCTCDGNTWQCPIIDCPPPFQGCPPPGSLQGGEPCYEQGAHPVCKSGQPYYDCDGNVQGYSDCTCELGPQGQHWQCMNIGTPWCADAQPPQDAGWSDGGWSDAGPFDAGGGG